MHADLRSAGWRRRRRRRRRRFVGGGGGGGWQARKAVTDEMVETFMAVRQLQLEPLRPPPAAEDRAQAPRGGAVASFCASFPTGMSEPFSVSLSVLTARRVPGAQPETQQTQLDSELVKSRCFAGCGFCVQPDLSQTRSLKSIQSRFKLWPNLFFRARIKFIYKLII
jgi:hypothetical protein